jgi:hypothetical protein
LLVCGGEIGGFGEDGWTGLGPWLGAYLVGAGGSLNKLFIQRFEELGPTLFNKLSYERGRLALFESGIDSTAVDLMDLQLLLWTCDPGFRSDASLGSGSAGSDLNNDGDYGDANELIPLPAELPPHGFINRGVILSALVGAPERIQDVDLSAGGNFICGVTSDSAGNSRLRILVSAGRRTVDSDPFNSVAISGRAKRVKTLFGTEVELANGDTRLADLILVSVDERLLVYEFVDSQHPPNLVGEVTFPSGAGLVQSVEIVTPAFNWPTLGMIAVSTTEDIFFLDPRRLLLPAQSSVSAALSGRMLGFGTGARSFVALSSGVVAASLGGKSKISAGLVDVIFTVNSLFAEDINQAAPAQESPLSLVPPTPPSPPDVRSSTQGTNLPPMLEVVSSKPTPSNFLAHVNARDVSGQELSLMGQARTVVPFVSGVIAGPATAKVYAHAVLAPADVTGKDITVTHTVNIDDTINYFLELHPYTQIGLSCEGKTVDVRIYPALKVTKEINLTPYIQPLTTALKDLSDALKASASGLVTGEFEVQFPKEAKFSFDASYKEAPGRNQVFFAPKAAVSLSPLIGARGRVKLGPKVPGLEANIFVEVYGKVDLKGSIERVVDNSISCPHWEGCLALPTTFGVKVGAHAEGGFAFGSPTVSIEINLDAKIIVTGSVCVKKPQQDWIIEGSLGAEFPGLIGNAQIEVNTMGGNFSLQDSVQIIGPQHLIFPPIKQTLATFSFN